ncbi:MAG: UDP-N-acetylglucosamine--N-acetylmuramyl-(pentapeptide) pyrophosphoryl-undecaprenol N-acetylglucosamine transferase [Anaerolinea sp.]|nr:UDP-N-acetylglucosamine--N-acetylmuramyl-(pentapeptide) pyrophosphoryl-undecaprenol N-acetylglucosamine transferase [Anaerolinea sp.]
MRLALTGGGTGGHILPALAVLEAVRARGVVAPEVRFFGPQDRGERARVEAAGLRFESVAAAAIRGRNLLQLIRSGLRLAWGTFTAVRKLRSFNPDVIFSTGGYGSFPCSLAARILRIPLVVYLPDVEPGWAVKAEKKLATRVTTTTEAALAFLPKQKTVVTGYPVRDAFFSLNRDGARAQLGFAPDDRVVVVAGATQGAHAINEAIFTNLAALLNHCSVVHITGPGDAAVAANARAHLPVELQGRYHVADFRDDLPAVMVAADLAVMRAGASVLGELPAAALPSILVPATYAGGHQRNNADWLGDAGAAVVLAEADLAQLPDSILSLLGDQPRLDAMRTAARGLARPDAAAAIAAVVEEVAKR